MNSKLQPTKSTKEGELLRNRAIMGAHLTSEEKRIIKTVSLIQRGSRSVFPLNKQRFLSGSLVCEQLISNGSFICSGKCKYRYENYLPLLFHCISFLQDGSYCGVRIHTGFSLLTKKEWPDECSKRAQLWQIKRMARKKRRHCIRLRLFFPEEKDSFSLLFCELSVCHYSSGSPQRSK